MPKRSIVELEKSLRAQVVTEEQAIDALQQDVDLRRLKLDVLKSVLAQVEGEDSEAAS
jgi:hypothetical protein